MAKGRTGTGRGGRTGRSRCRPGPRRRRSTGARSTWSSRGSGRWWRTAGAAGTATSASPTRPGRRRASPRRGRAGEADWIELRLKLLADVGLVGLPNAGKSSLLGRLTRAAPKVADYPFTTLSPVLGTIEGEDRQAVVADIPGLIEGAAEGAGLGHEFLAHVERCSMLVHLVDLAPLEGDPAANYETVRGELAAHGAGLERLPELVVLSQARPAAARGGRGGGGGVARAARRARARRARGLLGDRRGAGRAAPADPRRAAGGSAAGRAGPGAESATASSRPSTASTGPPARAATGSSARTTAASASSVAASSCCSSATTSKTKRRSPTSSSA